MPAWANSDISFISLAVIIFAVFCPLWIFRFSSTVHLKGFLISFLWLPGRHCEAIKSMLGLIAFAVVCSWAEMISISLSFTVYHYIWYTLVVYSLFDLIWLQNYDNSYRDKIHTVMSYFICIYINNNAFSNIVDIVIPPILLISVNQFKRSVSVNQSNKQFLSTLGLVRIPFFELRSFGSNKHWIFEASEGGAWTYFSL